jgi:hypothetical protein
MPIVEQWRRHELKEDLSPGCQSRTEEGGIVPPRSVLAPGTALRLLPQQSLVLRPGHHHCTLFESIDPKES